MSTISSVRPSVVQRTAFLNDLPDELLLCIVQQRGDEQGIPRRCRVLYIISVLNRRLRIFARPILLRDVRFKDSVSLHSQEYILSRTLGAESIRYS